MTNSSSDNFLKRSWPAMAVCAAFVIGAQFGGALSPAPASAQTPPGVPTTTPPFNSTEQRKVQIEQMEQVIRRLTAIETKLSSGISVKVTEMPAVVVKEPGTK